MYKIQVVSIFRQEKHRSCFYLSAEETQELFLSLGRGNTGTEVRDG